MLAEVMIAATKPIAIRFIVVPPLTFAQILNPLSTLLAQTHEKLIYCKRCSHGGTEEGSFTNNQQLLTIQQLSTDVKQIVNFLFILSGLNRRFGRLRVDSNTQLQLFQG